MKESVHQFQLREQAGTTKVQQVVEAIRRDIDSGALKRNTPLPSINTFSKEYNVARDTIEKAYKLLSKQGSVFAVGGKGYFVGSKTKGGIRVLLIFNKLSSYKKIVYDSFLKTLGKNAVVDLQIYHYDPALLREIIDTYAGKYQYYALMPHFHVKADEREYLEIINRIPEAELVLLDKRLPGFSKNCIEVYQDFQKDIYTALSSASDLMVKYHSLGLIIAPDSNHPREIIAGARQFCLEAKMKMKLLTSVLKTELTKGMVYVATNESDLAILVKKARTQELLPGRDIGIISFNETVLKELLDITVITTDFEAMGAMAANCILKGQIKQVSNPFYMIRRGSL